LPRTPIESDPSYTLPLQGNGQFPTVSGRGKLLETKFPTVSQRFLTVSHDVGENVEFCPFSS
jgi:hypothetical protein